jgi:hypothetical protein
MDPSDINPVAAHPAGYSDVLDELYEVVRTVVIGGRNWKYYRLDVCKRILAAADPQADRAYTVLAFVEDVLDVQRVAGTDQAVVGRTRIWTRWATFPAVRESDAEAALQAGLRLLSERLREG